jgi:hypothetical protein
VLTYIREVLTGEYYRSRTGSMERTQACFPKVSFFWVFCKTQLVTPQLLICMELYIPVSFCCFVIFLTNKGAGRQPLRGSRIQSALRRRKLPSFEGKCFDLVSETLNTLDMDFRQDGNALSRQCTLPISHYFSAFISKS